MRRVIDSYRDLKIFELGKNRFLVVTCDSAGGIGAKQLDRVKTSPHMVGKFTARVALMEMLAVGAEPICLSSTLSVEPSPTGEHVLEGMRDEMRRAHVTRETPLIVSSEKNFKVRQTGIGVTAIGIAKSLLLHKCKAGDEVVAVGLPRVGREVLYAEDQGLNADAHVVRDLVKSSRVHEVIPVGSRGILHEANVLARDSHLRFKTGSEITLDLRKSAGPATVVLCACTELESVRHLTKPINQVGTLIL